MSKYIQIYNPSFSFEIEIIFNVSFIKEDFNMLYSRKLNKHSNSFILSPIFSIQKITDDDNAFWFRYIYYDDIYSGIILTYEELLDMKFQGSESSNNNFTKSQNYFYCWDGEKMEKI